MRLKVEGLFGHFDYDLPLFENDGQIAILTGPNGFGKTTILRCMEALSKGDLSFFSEIKFQSLIFTADDARCLKIRRDGDRLIFAAGKITSAGEEFSAENGFTVREIEDFQKAAVHKINIFKNSGESTARKRLGDKLPAMVEIGQVMREIIGEVRLIPFLRLLAKEEDDDNDYDDDNYDDDDDDDDGDDNDDDDLVEPLKKIPGKIRQEIARATREYNKVSIELDSQFPLRLLSMKDGDAFTEEEFTQQYKMMGDKLNKLREIGISPATGLPDNLYYNLQDARALRILLDNFNQKYQAYAPLLEKLSLFRKVINDRFLFKSVEISEQQRLIVVDEKAEAAGSKRESLIPLENLSSGEKETLLMFYELIFEMGAENGRKDTLLLIDEPETSLHVLWQSYFIRDLEKIVKRSGFRAIIATHSPSFVNGHRSVQIDLGELYRIWQEQKKR